MRTTINKSVKLPGLDAREGEGGGVFLCATNRHDQGNVIVARDLDDSASVNVIDVRHKRLCFKLSADSHQ